MEIIIPFSFPIADCPLLQAIENCQLEIGNVSGGIAEDQSIKVGIVTKRVQIVIVLGANAQVRLEIECLLERLQSQINRTESSASCGQAVVNVCCFGFTFEGAFKHLLGGDIFAPVQFDNSSIVKRISIAWKNTFGPQARFRDGEVGTSSSCHLGNLRVLVYQNSELIAGLGEATSCEFLVRAFKRY